MFIARSRLLCSRPSAAPVVFNVGDEVIGFENWPLGSRECALATGQVEDTTSAGVGGDRSKDPPGVAGAVKRYFARVLAQRERPLDPMWRFGDLAGQKADVSEPISVSQDELACATCGKICKNERGLKIHQATSHRS